MNRRQIASTLYKEINKLNREIDLRIVKGRPYHFLAKKHQLMLHQLEKICTSSSWLPKTSFLFFL